MQGDKRIDELMIPVLNSINRHVKDRDAITDIYNRAYEAVINSMDVNVDTHLNDKVSMTAENAWMMDDYNDEIDQFNAGFEAGKEGKLDRYTDDPYDNKYDVWRLGYEAGSFDRLTAELAALREQVRWIPVSERLPEYGRAVLIMTTNSIVPRIGVHSPTIPQWATTDLLYYHDISYSQVTHWMPFPPPPEDE